MIEKKPESSGVRHEEKRIRSLESEKIVKAIFSAGRNMTKYLTELRKLPSMLCGTTVAENRDCWTGDGLGR